MNGGTRVTLYSVAACPYAQRTRILLDFKGVESDLVELDLSKSRPEWFLEINPTGKVPALVHGGRALGESSIINEYLEEVFPEQPLWPTDPYERARGRVLIEFCNTRFTSNMYRVLMEQDPGRRIKAEAAARSDWEWLETELGRLGSSGDLPLGDFSMVDLTFAPFFQRYELNEYFWGFSPPEGLERVARWRDTLESHPSVRATSLEQEAYIKLYADYSLGYSNGAIPTGKSTSALDLSVPLEDRPMPERRA